MLSTYFFRFDLETIFVFIAVSHFVIYLSWFHFQQIIEKHSPSPDFLLRRFESNRQCKLWKPKQNYKRDCKLILMPSRLILGSSGDWRGAIVSGIFELIRMADADSLNEVNINDPLSDRDHDPRWIPRPHHSLAWWDKDIKSSMLRVLYWILCLSFLVNCICYIFSLNVVLDPDFPFLLHSCLFGGLGLLILSLPIYPVSSPQMQHF